MHLRVEEIFTATPCSKCSKNVKNQVVFSSRIKQILPLQEYFDVVPYKLNLLVIVKRCMAQQWNCVSLLEDLKKHN